MNPDANLGPENLTLDRTLADDLRGFEHLFKSVCECSPAGMLILNSRGQCVWANQAFGDLLGYTRAEILGASFRGLTHPDDLGISLRTFRALISGETKSLQLEKRYVHKSGRPVWVLLSASLIPPADGLQSCLALGLIQDISRRKAAEEALQKSEALFRSIGENAEDLILMIDFPGMNIRYASPTYEKLLGYAPAELQGRDSRMLLHPDDCDIIRQEAEKMVRDGLNGSATVVRCCHKNGDLRYTEAQGCAVRNSRGELERVVVISRIIDDRLLAQQQLKEREERLQLLLDSTGEAIYGIDLDGRCTFCNKACLRVLGYKDSSQLLGKNMHDLIHHTHADGSHASVEECRIFRAFRTGSGTHVDDEVLWRADGTCFPAEYWSYPVRHDGKVVGCVVTFVDITERKAAEKALRRAHEEAELFINSVPSILIGINLNSRIKRWNLAASQVFGLANSEVIGKPLADCGVQWVRPDMQAEIESWCATGHHGRIDNVPFVVNGQARFLGLTVTWVDVPDGGCDELLIIGSDVTERKELEEQLRQAQKLEAIGQLAAGIAHEINTPTQYVGDNARFLQDSWPSLAELLSLTREMRQEAATGPISPQTLQRFDHLASAADFDYLQTEIPRAIDQSLEGTQRVAKIVRAMKEFSHPGSEEKRPIDINQAIESTITVARNEWKYVADVETYFDRNLPLVPCHAGEFNQAILNLLINAAQAIGQVVGDGSQGKGKITVSTMRYQEWAGIAICDTGAGIPEAIRSRIFEPFFTTKPVGKGTGQGLALAHTAIVRRHGGKIWFDSEIGKGTTFYISLPLTEAPE